eukprot:CAMPEP_0202447958 /NCGR_PEP_ID=MMETSP1360-20130828/6735_1 /ASSEMBLY_ACC=CAM_ASM_000848 /TAXON_ID=515479 /ORGANISM="Licmophora paradoxa, Strain CCMP2313" /LENGTH=258 /DNA_ID=CAMNT_0049065289 /DNA_START=93 /DNA_END=869 /DNA_ORIENTATION=+
MSSGLKKAGEAVVKTALKEARSVTAKESASVAPAIESSKETLMPWKGWVGRMLKECLGEDRYEAMRQLVFYRPNEIHDMNQIPNPSTKVPLNEDGSETRQFRYPSPGSEPPVRIPRSDATEDPYNTSYYTRDTGRRGLDPANRNPELQAVKLALMDPNSPEVQEMKEAMQPKSSPGNKGRFATGPTDYDPTGLRAAMSANHQALEASLDANMPDHLPYPEWYNRQDQVIAWYKDRDLPVPFGATGWGITPKEQRVAKW